MEAGGADSNICLVVVFEPVVNLRDVFELVDMVGRWGPLASNQTSLGGLKMVAMTSLFLAWGW